jgi:hypothetical protein
MKRRLLVLNLLTLGLAGCEYFRDAKGTVRDRITHRPLEAVKYQAIRGDFRDSIYQLTDRTGQVDVHIMCDGPDEDLVVQLTKPGYDTLLLRNTPDSVFYLTPRN